MVGGLTLKFKFGKLVLILLSFCFIVSCSSNKSANVKNMKKVLLSRVVDGDTLKVASEGKIENVKMLLIDAPELRGSHPFASEARRFVEKKLEGKEHVYLESDGQERDNNGKFLAYVWYYDNGQLKMLNDEIVKEGYARVAHVFDNAKHLKVLNQSQEISKQNKQNIWSIDGYVTDKGFKKKK